MIEIVEAKEEHIPALGELNLTVQKVHSNEYPELFKYPVDKIELEQEFKELLENNNYYVFVAIINNNVVAYSLSQYVNRPESTLISGSKKLYIHHMAVSEDYRNRGVGKKLLSHIHMQAERLEANEIGLDVWSFNSAAQALFRSYGFDVYNERMWLQL